MSATPRPWTADIRIEDGEEVVWGIQGPDQGYIVETDGGSYGPEPDDARLIVRAVNGFDALLAVAKRINTHYDADNGSVYCQTCSSADQEPHDADCALARLDREFPDWREWTP